MTIYVDDSMREWSEAYVESVRYVATTTGQPFNEAEVTAAIRSALTEPRRWTPGDDYEADVDECVSGRVAEEGADRAEARETAWREGRS